ncbi:PTS sugar transporter subunit IIA [Austwickia chelonae]|uniref:PTS sugar transporter subunit IIA n=1 Tax=Austwickia chelonae TaxID=100225 RepID=UPI000E275001|nr:PTS sugar transporter subunit IIA [Austwickia chelonae]
MCAKQGPEHSSLTDLLPPEAIHLHASAADWRAAVEEAGRLLHTSGSTTAAYTQQMIAAVDRFGPYIVIAPGFALAHAQASEAVLKPGMSWLSLDEPVSFGHPQNDPVDLVVGLASTDHDTHLEALRQIAEIISNPARRAELSAADDADQLLHAIDASLGKKDS